MRHSNGSVALHNCQNVTFIMVTLPLQAAMFLVDGKKKQGIECVMVGVWNVTDGEGVTERA